jgi:hypothetical protein
MNRNPEIIADGLSALELQLQNASQYVPRDSSDIVKPIIRKSKEFSKPKTIFNSAVAVIGGSALVIAGVGLLKYGPEFNAALLPHIAADGRVLAPGTVTLENLNLDIQSTPVAYADFEAKKREVGLTLRVQALNNLINFPFQQTTLLQSATARDTISLNTSSVKIAFDALKDTMKIEVPSDAALVSSINIIKQDTVDGTDWKLIPQTDLLVSAANEISGALKLVGVKDAESSKVIGVGAFADAATRIHSDLVNYANETIMDSAYRCTGQITQAEGFSKGITTNIKTAVGGILMDPAFTSNPSHKDLAILMDRPGTEVQQIVQHAELVFTTDSNTSSTSVTSPDYKIAPDKTNVANLANMTKSKIFSANIKQAECKTAQNITVIKPKSTSATPSPIATTGATK